MLSVGYNYDSREGEIMPIRVDQIDFADRTIRLQVGTTKNGHGRIVKMTQEVYMLNSGVRLDKATDDHLFTRKDDSSS